MATVNTKWIQMKYDRTWFIFLRWDTDYNQAPVWTDIWIIMNNYKVQKLKDKQKSKKKAAKAFSGYRDYFK